MSADHADTPSARGYRQPAEWAPHAATWLSWPHNRDSWPGVFAGVEPAMVEFVRALAACEAVYINVLDADHERHVRKLLASAAAPERMRLYRFPTNDAWARDHGAIFVTRPSPKEPRLAVDFGYNAWGGKYPPFDLDREIGRQMAEALDVPRYAKPGIVLEGGSIEVNGEGALLTTEQCLLNPNRNPTLTRADIERLLRDSFGVNEILWLGLGIEGDDTDGHIDDLTRFVAPDTVVTAVEDDPGDENYEVLAENYERLSRMKDQGGKPLRVIKLPMPGPVYFDGQRLPASYANFYIANKSVLVPTYRHANDAKACEILQRCFPDRRVVGVDCVNLIWGLGSIHCVTQQQPAAGMPHS